MTKLIPGKAVNLGGRDFILPPLSMGQLRNGMAEKMERHDRLVEESIKDEEEEKRAEARAKRREAQTLRVEIIAEALRRNYPDLTDDMAFDLVDLGNWPNAWNIILGGSGFQMGEEPAADQLPTGTSATFIEPSLEPLAGQ